jgi:hypothetical protein
MNSMWDRLAPLFGPIGLNPDVPGRRELCHRLLTEWTDERLVCFTPDAIAERAAQLALPAPMRCAAVECAQWLQTDAPWLRVAAVLRSLLLEVPDARDSAPQVAIEFRPPSITLHPAAPMLAAVVYLSATELPAALHRGRGIAPEVTCATLADLARWIDHYHTRTGHWGLENVRWLLWHWQGDLFELGRLQYQFAPFPWDYHVWRNRANTEFAILAATGVEVRGDGLPQGTNGERDDLHGWVAHYAEDTRGITGHAVTETGIIARESRTLAAAEWVRVGERNNRALSMHIPAGSPLDPVACADSLAQARHFFERHFPEDDIRLLYMNSWLLDPQLGQLLPATANLAQFQQIYRLVPVADANARQLLDRVFGSENPDLAKAPRDTRLRRLVLEHMEAGGQWRNGGGLRTWSLPKFAPQNQ